MATLNYSDIVSKFGALNGKDQKVVSDLTMVLKYYFADSIKNLQDTYNLIDDYHKFATPEDVCCDKKHLRKVPATKKNKEGVIEDTTVSPKDYTTINQPLKCFVYFLLTKYVAEIHLAFKNEDAYSFQDDISEQVVKYAKDQILNPVTPFIINVASNHFRKEDNIGDVTYNNLFTAVKSYFKTKSGGPVPKETTKLEKVVVDFLKFLRVTCRFMANNLYHFKKGAISNQSIFSVLEHYRNEANENGDGLEATTVLELTSYINSQVTVKPKKKEDGEGKKTAKKTGRGKKKKDEEPEEEEPEEEETEEAADLGDDDYDGNDF